MLIEILIFTGFVIFAVLYCTSLNRILSIFAFLASSTALEIMNLSVFKGQGTIYPESILYFPGYRFPVAIVLFSAIYGGIIVLISLRIINTIKPKHLRKTLFFFIAAGLNFASLFIEKAGIMSGYWIHEKVKNVTDIWHFIYLFYFVVVISGIFFLVEEAQRKN